MDGDVKVVFGPFNSGVAIPISRLLDQAGVVMATVASEPGSHPVRVHLCLPNFGQ
ncbi:hypothetical protein ACU4GD_10490 [Cupriavidus basilensis]